MPTSPKYADGPEARRPRVTIHGLLVFTAAFAAVVLAAAALLDLFF